MLGQSFPQATPEERFLAAAQSAFAAFPQLQRMAATIRGQRSVDHHVLSAIDVLRDRTHHLTPAYELAAIVDRIGTGDAFAAGVLHGAMAHMDDADGLHFGLAAACLKHSLPGDFNLLGIHEVSAFLGENGFDVRR